MRVETVELRVGNSSTDIKLKRTLSVR